MSSSSVERIDKLVEAQKKRHRLVWEASANSHNLMQLMRIRQIDNYESPSLEERREVMSNVFTLWRGNGILDQLLKKSGGKITPVQMELTRRVCEILTPAPPIMWREQSRPQGALPRSRHNNAVSDSTDNRQGSFVVSLRSNGITYHSDTPWHQRHAW